MNRFRLDIRNRHVVLADKDGRDYANVLEAAALAKTALQAMAVEWTSIALPWIEILDEAGNIVATVRGDELPN